MPKTALKQVPPSAQGRFQDANRNHLSDCDEITISVKCGLPLDWPEIMKPITGIGARYHLTALMDLTAVEGKEGSWRYKDRLLAQRKNALAVLLRLQGK